MSYISSAARQWVNQEENRTDYLSNLAYLNGLIATVGHNSTDSQAAKSWDKCKRFMRNFMALNMPGIQPTALNFIERAPIADMSDAERSQYFAVYAFLRKCDRRASHMNYVQMVHIGKKALAIKCENMK